MPLFSIEAFLLRSTCIRFILMLSNFLNRTKVLLTRNLNTFNGHLQIFIQRKKLKPDISVSLDTRNVGNSSNKGVIILSSSSDYCAVGGLMKRVQSRKIAW